VVAGDFMANETSGAVKGSDVGVEPVFSGNENYEPHESGRAQNDFVSRAFQYVKGCGAIVEWPPPNDLGDVLRSEFWFFIYNAGVHRQAAEGTAQRIEESKRKLTELMKTMLPLLELLRNDSHTRALAALHVENWLAQRHAQAQPIHGDLLGETTRQCLELLYGAIEQAVDRLRTSKTGPRKDRGRLIRWALEEPENRGGWWPANPTDEDLTALSILTGVCLETFEDDFDDRDKLAQDAAHGSVTITHLQGLWHKERSRCGELRRSMSV
jgi:hypothetical protein